MLDQLAFRIDRIPQLSMKFCCWRCCTFSDRAPSPRKYQIILIVVGKKEKKVLLAINFQFLTERAGERKVRGRCTQLNLGAGDAHKSPFSHLPYNHRNPQPHPRYSHFSSYYMPAVQGCKYPQHCPWSFSPGSPALLSQALNTIVVFAILTAQKKTRIGRNFSA